MPERYSSGEHPSTSGPDEIQRLKRQIAAEEAKAEYERRGSNPVGGDKQPQPTLTLVQDATSALLSEQYEIWSRIKELANLADMAVPTQGGALKEARSPNLAEQVIENQESINRRIKEANDNLRQILEFVNQIR